MLGRRFDWSLLPEVTGLSADRRCWPGCAPRCGPGWSRWTRPETFRFRHALTGDAIRDDLLPPERRALARSAAEIVERRDPEAYALAAGLRAAAGDEQRAAELSVAAGRQAVRRGALHSADLLLTRAAELAGDGADLRGLAERALLDVLAAKGDAERALALGERLLAAGDAGVRLVLAQVAADAERWDVVAAYLSAVPDDGDPRVGVLAARLAHARGRPEQAREMAKAALATARKRGSVVGRLPGAGGDRPGRPGRRRGRRPGRLRRGRAARRRARPAAGPGVRAARARHRRPAGGRLDQPAGAGPVARGRRRRCSAWPRRWTCRSPPACCTATSTVR